VRTTALHSLHRMSAWPSRMWTIRQPSNQHRRRQREE
jgi:hypothetical protein